MKVKLLKDFGEHKKGDTVSVEKERAKYWDLVGVAKKATDTKEAPTKTAAPKKAATKTATKQSTKKGKK